MPRKKSKPGPVYTARSVTADAIAVLRQAGESLGHAAGALESLARPNPTRRKQMPVSKITATKTELASRVVELEEEVETLNEKLNAISDLAAIEDEGEEDDADDGDEDDDDSDDDLD